MSCACIWVTAASVWLKICTFFLLCIMVSSFTVLLDSVQNERCVLHCFKGDWLHLASLQSIEDPDFSSAFSCNISVRVQCLKCMPATSRQDRSLLSDDHGGMLVHLLYHLILHIGGGVGRVRQLAPNLVTSVVGRGFCRTAPDKILQVTAIHFWLQYAAPTSWQQ